MKYQRFTPSDSKKIQGLKIFNLSSINIQFLLVVILGLFGRKEPKSCHQWEFYYVLINGIIIICSLLIQNEKIKLSHFLLDEKDNFCIFSRY